MPKRGREKTRKHSGPKGGAGFVYKQPTKDEHDSSDDSFSQSSSSASSVVELGSSTETPSTPAPEPARKKSATEPQNSFQNFFTVPPKKKMMDAAALKPADIEAALETMTDVLELQNLAASFAQIALIVETRAAEIQQAAPLSALGIEQMQVLSRFYAKHDPTRSEDTIRLTVTRRSEGEGEMSANAFSALCGKWEADTQWTRALHENVQLAFRRDVIPLELIQKYFRKARDYIHMYKTGGCSGANVEAAVKLYRTHRRIFESALGATAEIRRPLRIADLLNPEGEMLAGLDEGGEGE